MEKEVVAIIWNSRIKRTRFQCHHVNMWTTMYNNRAVSRTAAYIIQTYLTPRAALFVRFPVEVTFFFTMRTKTLDRFNQQSVWKTYKVIRALHNLFISWTSLRGAVFIGQSQFSSDNGTQLGRSKISRWFKWEGTTIDQTHVYRRAPFCRYYECVCNFLVEWQRLIKMKHKHATLRFLFKNVRIVIFQWEFSK